ncbi:MAG: hypothetical protein HPY61_11935 [Methanotrichaceae archaeon]|nr:hypothetical protein [Methanotrichaceae archaeon]
MYFGPQAPDGEEKNWVKTLQWQGWFAYIRLYGRLSPCSSRYGTGGYCKTFDRQ